MPTAYDRLRRELREQRECWLVTGGAGFIGSHLVQTLLSLDQFVTCLDDFSSGTTENISGLLESVTPEQRERLQLVEGDAADPETCHSACSGVSRILHQAGISSVPASIADPTATHRANATGTINLFRAAHQAGIDRIVFASSCAVYGNDPELPKSESSPTSVPTPYAASKRVCEIYGEAFARSFGLTVVALRYFNVFGPRQDPGGAYAAVIPLWISAMLRGEPIFINGDGESTRDFCFIDDIVQANLLAAMAPELDVPCPIFNVASGTTISLTALAGRLGERIGPLLAAPVPEPVYRDFREGDIRHSSASIDAIRLALDYEPAHSFTDGIDRTIDWYRRSSPGVTEGANQPVGDPIDRSLNLPIK